VAIHPWRVAVAIATGGDSPPCAWRFSQRRLAIHSRVIGDQAEVSGDWPQGDWRFTQGDWRFSRRVWRFGRRVWRFARGVWRFSPGCLAIPFANGIAKGSNRNRQPCRHPSPCQESLAVSPPTPGRVASAWAQRVTEAHVQGGDQSTQARRHFRGGRNRVRRSSRQGPPGSRHVARRATHADHGLFCFWTASPRRLH
jgi:hypothetical protein